MLSESNDAAPGFVPVRVAPPAPACRVLLPNCVVVEIPGHTVSTGVRYVSTVNRWMTHHIGSRILFKPR